MTTIALRDAVQEYLRANGQNGPLSQSAFVAYGNMETALNEAFGAKPVEPPWAGPDVCARCAAMMRATFEHDNLQDIHTLRIALRVAVKAAERLLQDSLTDDHKQYVELIVDSSRAALKATSDAA